MRKFIALFLITLSVVSFLFSAKLSLSQGSEKTLYVIPVEGTIDLGLSAFIKRALQLAQESNAAAVILQIDTFGGRIDAADEIVNSVAELSPIPTYAYVTHSAWSAGALIALSCKKIIMTNGSSIGSAEPRVMGITPGAAQSTDEKIISALRAKFKATAELNNHSINLAQAMVDKEIELNLVQTSDAVLILTDEEIKEKKSSLAKKKYRIIKTICSKGKLLNLTAAEAKELKLSVLTVDSKEQFFDYMEQQINPDSLEKLSTVTPTLTWSENLVRILTHPIFSSLLLSLGFLGVFFELKMPGWGVSGTLGVLFLVLFFWGHYLVGLANWTDITIFVIGVIFLLIELLVVPGFGILGFSGIIFMLCGLILTLLKYPFTFPSFELSGALHVLSGAFIITFILGILGFNFLPRTRLFKSVVLQTQENKDEGYEINSLPENIVVGKIGLSKTILRPSGRAIFNDEVFDVTTLGEFIPKDKHIVIVKIEGNKIFVEERRSA